MEKQKTHINKGLAIAAALVVLDIIFQLSHQKLQPWVLYVETVILTVGVIGSIFINNKLEKPSFSNLFGYGFQVSVVVVCILFIYTILSTYVIFTGYINDIYQQQLMHAKQITPNFNLADAEKNKAMAIKVIGITTVSSVVIFNLAVGIAAAFVGGVIGSVALKKNA